ncbi:MAG: hypothetical protein ACI4KL_01800 [Lentihominibacter sp.]
MEMAATVIEEYLQMPEALEEAKERMRAALNMAESIIDEDREYLEGRISHMVNNKLLMLNLYD